MFLLPRGVGVNRTVLPPSELVQTNDTVLFPNNNVKHWFWSNLALQYQASNVFFADYASQDLPRQESEWCQAGIIEYVEIMACFLCNYC